MAALTRRAFLAAVGLVLVPSAAHAHHRDGHGKGAKPAPPPLDAYADTY